MTRKRRASGKQKIIVLVGAAAMVGGVAIATTGTSHASVTCDGLAAALNKNQRFIADQKANPDTNSAARIANREAVIRKIQVQQKESDCAPLGRTADPKSLPDAGNTISSDTDVQPDPPTGTEPPQQPKPPAGTEPPQQPPAGTDPPQQPKPPAGTEPPQQPPAGTEPPQQPDPPTGTGSPAPEPPGFTPRAVGEP
ncbi:hypothetical protein [Wenjunlia tyrosinilytica]|uniref:Uncharacterized protein n=1 Tax=Wenjunlia tyrosinilytica TaxID=1544741 RepID=A0A917ZTK8_9ACTN|nr:hypothetical protein [Wenjunlia tyrosinilytica]GGO94392.1 hypothetical protein GCM10012280_49110 [Wenjunlia tyrosinilytica]